MSTDSFHFQLFRNRSKNYWRTVFGCFYTYFWGLYKVFSRHKATSKKQSLSSANYIMTYAAEGKCKGFLWLCVKCRFDYSNSYRPLLKLNLVETIPRWFSGLFTSISLLIRVVAWLVVDDSDIARIIISDSSESEGKQMKVPFCRSHGCFGGLWFHWKWTSLCTAKTCLDLAIHWYTEKRGKSGMFLLLPFLQYSLAFLRQTVMRPCQFSLYWKLSYAYLGARVFKLSSRIFLRLYILVIPCSNLVANEDYAFIGDPSGVFTRVVIVRVVLPYIWIVFSGKCSPSSPDLVPSAISHRRLANALLVFSSLPFFCHIAKEDTGDRGKLFGCVIRVVYRTTGFSTSKRISKNEAWSHSLVWPPLIFQACGSLYR